MQEVPFSSLLGFSVAPPSACPAHAATTAIGTLT